MQKEITLVDRGRGLQLSTSRITVHDLVPYFQEGCSHDEIIRWLPSLTPEEIRVVEHRLFRVTRYPRLNSLLPLWNFGLPERHPRRQLSSETLQRVRDCPVLFDRGKTYSK